MREESLILSHLVLNEDYSRAVLPFIKAEYFSDRGEKILFQLIENYTNKYNRLPTKEALYIDLEKVKNLDEETYSNIQKIVKDISIDKETDNQWLEEISETWCRNRSVYNALMTSISIYDGKDKTHTTEAIPDLLSEAIAVNFDNKIGHDFIENPLDRWKYYTREENRIPFNVDILNKITTGGLTPGTLSIFLAGVHVGKTLTMCSLATGHLMLGKNVLYITLEMSEEEISRRIDANMLDVDIGEIKNLTESEFIRKTERATNKTTGKLIVKQFPTASAGAHHFRHLLHELKLKKKFIPDVVYIDYINLCISSRIKNASGANSYTIVKAIAEELRGLAIETQFACISATQLTRSGSTNSDVGMEDTAESFGLPATADSFFAITQPDELKDLNQYLFKQLKNRFGDVSRNTRFVVGVDKPKMRIYDLEEGAQDELVQDEPKQQDLKKVKFLDFK